MPNDHKPGEPGRDQAGEAGRGGAGQGGAGQGDAGQGDAGAAGGGQDPGLGGQWSDGGGRGPGRRAFLTLAGVVAAAVPVSSFLAACESGRSAGGTATTAGRSAGSIVAALCAPSPCAGHGVGTAPALADWHTLRRGLSTKELIQPGQGGYTTARELFDPRFDAVEPAGIAYCRTPQDVSACLAFVRRFGLPVAARSGGHSYGGFSSSTGLVVDVTRMNSFRVAAGGNSVQVGTGTRLVDFYNGLAAHGLAVPGGSCPTVGVAGLTLGGGVGVLSRAYGLTSDHLEAVQIVTADSKILECDARRNSDLLWACRGGGGGNFGVATSFTFSTRQLSRLVIFFLSWPWSQAARVVEGWQSWVPSTPDALWSNLHLIASLHGPLPTVQVGGTYLGPVGAAESLLNRLYAAVGSQPASPYVAETSYLNAMMVEAGCADYSVSQCHLPTQTANGKLSREPSYAKSDFFTRRLPPAAIRTLVAGIEQVRGVRGAVSGVGAIAFDALGGAVNRVHPAATAFVHRDALFLAQYSTKWHGGAPGSEVASQRAWLRTFYASLHPYASGQAYQNYLDTDLTDWRQAYYGANYPRLAAIKATYDPRQIFRFPQGITPA
jgi:FAD/FMN-containing dehydrogenase